MGSRTDWLRELRGLLLVAAIASAAYTVVSAVLTMTGRAFSVGVPAGSVLEADAVRGLPAGVVLDDQLNVYLKVVTPTTEQRLLAALATVPAYLLTTAVLILLWRLVRQASTTEPFTIFIARRLHVLGWLAVVGGPATFAIALIVRFILSSTVLPNGSAALVFDTSVQLGDLGWPAVWMLAGFGFLAIAEIVRRGQALRAELDEVV
jgi:hypothetical protein